MLYAERQYFLIREGGSTPTYVLGWDLPKVVHAMVPILDKEHKLGWKSTVLEHKYIPASYNGYVTSFSSACCRHNISTSSIGFVYNTFSLTGGSKSTYPELLPAAFAGYVRHGTLQRLFKSPRELLREAAKLFAGMSSSRVLNIIMDLTPKARHKFLVDTIDWISIIGGLNYTKTYVTIPCKNSAYRLVFQILLNDLGVTPSISFGTFKTRFKFRKSVLSMIRSFPITGKDVCVSEVKLQDTRSVFDYAGVLFLDSTNYLGGTLFCL